MASAWNCEANANAILECPATTTTTHSQRIFMRFTSNTFAPERALMTSQIGVFVGGGSGIAEWFPSKRRMNLQRNGSIRVSAIRERAMRCGCLFKSIMRSRERDRDRARPYDDAGKFHSCRYKRRPSDRSERFATRCALEYRWLDMFSDKRLLLLLELARSLARSVPSRFPA